MKKRAKQREHMVCHEMQIASGEKSRFEIEESNFRRRLEGTMMRKRGILRQEADAEIEKLLENWRQDVLAGRVSLTRGVSAAEREKRQQRQVQHHIQKSAARQGIRMQRLKAWHLVGKAAIFGDAPATFRQVANQMCPETTTAPVWPPVKEVPVTKEKPVAAVKPIVEDIVPLH